MQNSGFKGKPGFKIQNSGLNGKPGFKIQISGFKGKPRFKIQSSRFRIQDLRDNPDSRYKIQDSSENPNMPGLAYREAHTPYAAAEAVECLASALGLEPARASRPGHIVLVYRLSTAGASKPHHTASDPHPQAAA